MSSIERDGTKLKRNATQTVLQFEKRKKKTHQKTRNNTLFAMIPSSWLSSSSST